MSDAPRLKLLERLPGVFQSAAARFRPPRGDATGGGPASASLASADQLFQLLHLRRADALSIARLYRGALATLPEVEDFVALMRAGVKPGVLARELTGSTAFIARHGARDFATPSVIGAFYLNLFGRAAEAAELAGWDGDPRLSGLSRAEALLHLAASEEAGTFIQSMTSGLPVGRLIAEPLIYQWWIIENETALPPRVRRMAAEEARRLPYRPLIRIVIRVETYVPAALFATIGSIREQYYDRIRVEVDCRNEAEVDAVAMDLDRLPAPCGEMRITVGSGANLFSDRADLVAVIAQGDQLSEFCIVDVAIAANLPVRPELIYTDEDGILDGRRGAPVFKPDLDMLTLAVGNSVGNLAAYSQRLFADLRRECRDLSDYEIVLHAVERVGAGRIHHIAEVHFHRARATEAASGRTEWGVRDLAAARRHVAGMGLPATVEPRLGRGRDVDGVARQLVWARPKQPPGVSVIVPTRDRADLLAICLDGLLNATSYEDLEVVIVDNDSVQTETHALLARMASDSRVKVTPIPGPFNWSAANNLGVRTSRGELLVLLNNDIEVRRPDWLADLAAIATMPDVGVVGAKLLYEDGRVQHAGMEVDASGWIRHVYRYAGAEEPGYLGMLQTTRRVAAVTGACLAIRRAVFDEVGGLDEDHLPMTWNDVDLCFRVQERGYRVVWTPSVELTHLEMATRGREVAGETVYEHSYMQRRWGSRLRRKVGISDRLTPTDSDLVVRPSRF